MAGSCLKSAQRWLVGSQMDRSQQRTKFFPPTHRCEIKIVCVWRYVHVRPLSVDVRGCPTVYGAAGGLSCGNLGLSQASSRLSGALPDN